VLPDTLSSHLDGEKLFSRAARTIIELAEKRLLGGWGAWAP
jgi:hypothetical protein